MSKRRMSLWALVLAGCATHAVTPDPTPVAIESSPVSAEPVAPMPTPPTPVARAPFTLTRGEVNRTLDAAPGAFLRRVSTEVRLRQGRFAGWRIVSFAPSDLAFTDGPLQAGDVILRVNGHTLERPDDLLDLWQALRSAPSLTVELERNGVGSTLRWTIVD